MNASPGRAVTRCRSTSSRSAGPRSGFPDQIRFPRAARHAEHDDLRAVRAIAPRDVADPGLEIAAVGVLQLRRRQPARLAQIVAEPCAILCRGFVPILRHSGFRIDGQAGQPLSTPGVACVGRYPAGAYLRISSDPLERMREQGKNVFMQRDHREQDGAARARALLLRGKRRRIGDQVRQAQQRQRIAGVERIIRIVRRLVAFIVVDHHDDRGEALRARIDAPEQIVPHPRRRAGNRAVDEMQVRARQRRVGEGRRKPLADPGIAQDQDVPACRIVVTVDRHRRRHD